MVAAGTVMKADRIDADVVAEVFAEPFLEN